MDKTSDTVSTSFKTILISVPPNVHLKLGIQKLGAAFSVHRGTKIIVPTYPHGASDRSITKSSLLYTFLVLDLNFEDQRVKKLLYVNAENPLQKLSSSGYYLSGPDKCKSSSLVSRVFDKAPLGNRKRPS